MELVIVGCASLQRSQGSANDVEGAGVICVETLPDARVCIRSPTVIEQINPCANSWRGDPPGEQEVRSSL
jgi:hypothetical protein